MQKRKFLRGLALLLPLACLAQVSQAQQQDMAGSVLAWSQEQQLAGYPNVDELYPTREVKAGGLAFPLPKGAGLEDFSYRFNKRRGDVDSFMLELHTAGLILVHKGRVRLEEYRLDHGPERRWISFSIAKSVTSLLFGIALAEGYIGSVDEPVTRYLPDLKDGPYANTSIKDLLQMSSGVAWNEDYADPESDIARLPQGQLALIEYMNKLPRAAKPGAVFNYSTAETDLAGAVLRSAIGNNLSSWLGSRIWRPFGMGADANWLIDAEGGSEFAGCCINATLRDYARLGLLMLRKGRSLSGVQLVPEKWIEESLAPAASNEGYGYYWWLMEDGAFAALGAFGQMIWVDPKRELVIAMHSAWPRAEQDRLDEHAFAFFRALADAAADDA